MTRRWIVVLGALALGGLALGAAPACERSLLGAPCPCAEGWACCSADNTCHPAGTACTGGDAGPSATGDGGASVCSAAIGHVTSYTTVAQLETMVGGDWLRCSGTAYPSEFGVGLRISPDHSWNALENSDAGALTPIATGFDGYGTWTAEEIYAGHFQFDLLKLGGGGAGYIITFLDTGQMQMDPGGVPTVYRRPGASCPCLAGGADAGPSIIDAGDAGPGVSDAGDAGSVACSAQAGHVIPYTTTAEQETLIEGDWLRCSGMAYPSEFGVGLRISPDHTWNALEANGTGGLAPITTGFDGYGTWTNGDNGGGQIQFNLLKITGGGAGFFVTFTDNGQMLTDFFTASALYQRLPAGSGP